MATKIEKDIALGPRAAATARSALERIESDVPRAVLEDIRLLVSELVTNSYRHGRAGPGATARITIEVEDGCVHVDIEDHGRGFVPSVRADRGLDRLSGWGLTIVDRVADRWGVTRDGGTHVWFEVSTPGESAQRSA